MADTSPTEFVSDMIDSAAGEHIPFLGSSYFGNTVLAYATSVAIFVFVCILLSIIRRAVHTKIRKLAQKTDNTLDDAFVDALEKINGPFYFGVALYVSVQHLALPHMLDLVIRAYVIFVIVAEVIKIIEKVALYILSAKMGGRDEQEEKQLSSALALIIRVALWIIGILLIVSNLGFNVTSLIASLGIGGLAISLALQPVLTDIFSSFSIALDKPFEEGDFIVVGDFKGDVKKIGLKTTRLQALQGEELVLSNTELTNARVQNFKKLEKRRVVFATGATYDATPEQLRRIPDIVKHAIESQGDVEFGRSHFQEFGESEYVFEHVYYVTTGDYEEYMDIQQAINLAIIDGYAKEGLEMAFPTRTVHLISS